VRFGPQTTSEEAFDCGVLGSADLLSADICACFDCGLMMAVPERLNSETGKFELNFGYLESDTRFKLITINFNSSGELQYWNYQTYCAPINL
jgi:hypothetical protein